MHASGECFFSAKREKITFRSSGTKIAPEFIASTEYMYIYEKDNCNNREKVL